MASSSPRRPPAQRPPAKRPSARRPPTDVRKQPAQQRSRALVDALLEATARVLAAEGLEALTTTRVAEVAGVSVGSLYQYFPSKEALVAALIQDRVERDEERIKARCLTLAGAPLEEVLRALAELVVAPFREAPELYREMVSAMSAVERERAVEATVDRCTALTGALLAPHRDRLAVRDVELAGYLAATAAVAVVRDAARRRPELLAGEALAEELYTMLSRYLIGPG